jgi:glycosyltransferase involved in cell wall biosynthesis
MARYKVSVIMAAFNASETIQMALESIPDREDIEIIVVDDGSTDDTAKKVREFGRAKLVQHKKNYGLGKALNTGLKESSGEYVVMLDADDDFYPLAFEDCMEDLDETDLVYFNLITNDGTIFDLSPGTKDLYCGQTKFMRRAFIGESKYDESAPVAEDVPFWNELKAKNPTEKFTGLLVKHYNSPREGSLTWRRQQGEFNDYLREKGEL